MAGRSGGHTTSPRRASRMQITVNSLCCDYGYRFSSGCQCTVRFNAVKNIFDD